MNPVNFAFFSSKPPSLKSLFLKGMFYIGLQTRLIDLIVFGTSGQYWTILLTRILEARGLEA